MRGSAHPGAREAPRLGVLLALLASLAGCGVPHTKADCDQLLSQGQWNTVLADCDNPYHRASAYLGLAGLDLFTILESNTPVTNVVTLLGLTQANIFTTLGYVNHAVQEVSNPQSGTQAFALLVSAFLGLGVTTEAYLDIGHGSPALSGNITQQDVLTATGVQSNSSPLVLAVAGGETSITVGGTTVSGLTVLVADPYFAVVSSGAAYLVDCGNPADCTKASAVVYADPDGSGRLTAAVISAGSSPRQAAVLSAMRAGTADSVALVVQLVKFGLPFYFASAANTTLQQYLGQGQPTGTFTIGLAGYLGDLDAASGELSSAGGTPGGTALSQSITTLVNRFDNGASGCSTGTAAVDTFFTYLNGLYAIYQAAPGTLSSPAVPASFAASNLVAASAISKLTPILVPALPSGTGIGNTLQYKFLFPTTDAASFVLDPSNSTPRVDETTSAFRTQFESMPTLAPIAAGDNKVSFPELLCAGAG